MRSRGDHLEAIYRDRKDPELFLATLAEACGKTDWQVHAFRLMSDHFHLVLETPRGNLVEGMKWLLGTYTSRFNHKHYLFGHLFAGRYKALPVEVRDSSFVGNRVIGTAGSTGSGKIPSSGGSVAMGGGITIDSGLTATILNCWFSDNAVTGGAGGGNAPGGAGVGGGLSVGFLPLDTAIGPSSTVTISGTTISRNQAIGGAEGGEGIGGGYAVGIGVLFGIRDTSSVTVNGGSVVRNNVPDDVFHF